MQTYLALLALLAAAVSVQATNCCFITFTKYPGDTEESFTRDAEPFCTAAGNLAGNKYVPYGGADDVWTGLCSGTASGSNSGNTGNFLYACHPVYRPDDGPAGSCKDT